MSLVAPGMRLNNRFVLIEQIGTGGMSQVWRATDELLGRPVAVKMLATEIEADPGLRETTWREARAAARLTHPAVTRVYDYGEAALPGGGRAAYLVMELVEGESLAHRLAVAGPLSWPEAARIGAHVAAALAAAHELGVVHHDIKPGNVMLTADGAKVLDFGTAALVGAIDQDALVGTPSYTAPERLEWAPAQPASDLYSLGVLLYESLTGAPPATLGSWAEAVAHRAGGDAPVVMLPALPPEAEQLLRACLSPDPADRPLARRVAAVLVGQAGMPDPAANIPAEPPTVAAPLPRAVGTAARPVSPTRVNRRRPATLGTPRGGRRLLLAGIAVAAVVLGLVVLAVALPRDAPPPTGGPGPADGSGSLGPTGPPSATAPSSADPRAVVAEIDQAIGDASGAGTLDQDAAQKLRDRLRDLVKELEKPNENAEGQTEKLREKAEDLQEEVEELQEDGEVPEALAAELRRLLASLDEPPPGP
ncbi:MAG: protein kinase [Micromonosporaceae bacterium]|nr:protein kinase [Micromonosporaceae bacterium]